MANTSIIREFTDEQILAVMKALGSDDYREMDTGYAFRTVCHHGDSMKLYYYKESQQFHCYTHCAKNFDLYSLVQTSRHCSFFEALQFIQGILGTRLMTERGFADTPGLELDSFWEIIDKYSKSLINNETSAPIYLPDTLPDYFSKVPVREWELDGISRETQEKFGIRFDVAGNAAIIPHRDKEGRLVGIRSRSFNPEVVAAGCKYMPTQIEQKWYKHSLRDHLYGLDIVKEGVRRTGKLMLCEAEKSVMQAYTMYGENSFVVATCGSNISKAQRDLVLSMGVREVFIGFDKEYTEAYSAKSDHYADKLIRLASLFAPYVTTYVLFDTQNLLGYKDSPTDKGQEVLEELLRHKFEITTQEQKGDTHG